MGLPAMTLEDDVARELERQEELAPDDPPTLWPELGPPKDPTPIERGGAVLIVTLSPAEVAYLLELEAPDLVTGLHRVLDEARELSWLYRS